MLRSLKDLEGYTVCAIDGDIGKVQDFLLDDERWVTRYLVAATGGLLDRREVLITPISFREADWSSERFHLSLTRDNVKNSPDIDTDKPVSRQRESDYHLYYGYPYYWGYTGLWGMGAYPGMLTARAASASAPEQANSSDDSDDVHLRSAKEVRGYDIQGRDDTVGHVEDFIVDDATWAVRYLVIDTRKWWFGKHVLVAPSWANRVSWHEKKVHVDLPRESIRNSPEWDPNQVPSRDYEERLYRHYGREPYWGGDAASSARTQSESRGPM